MRYPFVLAALLGVAIPLTATAQSVELRLGHAVFESHPNHDTAVRFKEAVERISSGDIKINIYPSRQLGDVKELMEGVELGTVDMTVNTTSALATMIPVLNAFQLPGVIPDYDGFAELAVAPSTRAILDLVENHGVIALGLYEGGQRHVLSVKAPVESLDGLKGLKTRVPPVPLFIDIWNAAGVNPTPMAYGEVYSSLETGALDAVEINLSSIDSEKFYEVAKGVTLTGHYFWPSPLVINKGVFDSLTPEQQKAIRDAANEIVKPQVQAVADQDVQIRADIEKRGIPVIEPSEEFKAQLNAAFAPVVEKYVASDPLIADFVAEANRITASR